MYSRSWRVVVMIVFLSLFTANILTCKKHRSLEAQLIFIFIDQSVIFSN